MRKIVFTLLIIILLAGLGGYHFFYRKEDEPKAFLKQVLSITDTEDKTSENKPQAGEVIIEDEIKSKSHITEPLEEKKTQTEVLEEEAKADDLPSPKVAKEEAVAVARSCSKNESVLMYGYLRSRIGRRCTDNPIDPLAADYLEVEYFGGLYDPVEDALVYQASPDEEIVKRSVDRPYWNVLFGFKDTYDLETGFRKYNPSVRVEIDALDGRVARVYYGSPIVFNINGEKLPIDFGL